MRGVSTVKRPFSDGSIVTWSSTARGPSPDSDVTSVTGLPKITRICASDSTFPPIGEIEDIQGGNAGFAIGATAVSFAGAAGWVEHEAVAAMPRTASTEPSNRRNGHPFGRRGSNARSAVVPLQELP